MKTKLLLTIFLLGGICLAQEFTFKGNRYLIEESCCAYLSVSVDKREDRQPLREMIAKIEGVETVYLNSATTYTIEVTVGKMFDKRKILWCINAVCDKYYKEKK
jgi:hypothetical protein